MASLEDDLKQFVERRSPSPEFSAKVMARVRAERRPAVSFRARWLAAGVAAASVLFGGYFWQQRQAERIRVEAARELVTSLEIASAKMEKARKVILQSMKEDVL